MIIVQNHLNVDRFQVEIKENWHDKKTRKSSNSWQSRKEQKKKMATKGHRWRPERWGVYGIKRFSQVLYLSGIGRSRGTTDVRPLLEVSRIRRDLFYLLDYVTPSEIFQIGDRKKEKKDILWNKSLCTVIFWTWVTFAWDHFFDKLNQITLHNYRC